MRKWPGTDGLPRLDRAVHVGRRAGRDREHVPPDARHAGIVVVVAVLPGGRIVHVEHCRSLLISALPSKTYFGIVTLVFGRHHLVRIEDLGDLERVDVDVERVRDRRDRRCSSRSAIARPIRVIPDRLPGAVLELAAVDRVHAVGLAALRREVRWSWPNWITRGLAIVPTVWPLTFEPVISPSVMLVRNFGCFGKRSLENIVQIAGRRGTGNIDLHQCHRNGAGEILRVDRVLHQDVVLAMIIGACTSRSTRFPDAIRNVVRWSGYVVS